MNNERVMVQSGTTVRQEPWAIGEKVRVMFHTADDQNGEIVSFTMWQGETRALVRFQSGATLYLPFRRLMRVKNE